LCYQQTVAAFVYLFLFNNKFVIFFFIFPSYFVATGFFLATKYIHNHYYQTMFGCELCPVFYWENGMKKLLRKLHVLFLVCLVKFLYFL